MSNRIIISIVISCLVFSSCSSSDKNYEDQSDLDVQMDSLRNEYEEKINLLIEDNTNLESQVDGLHDRIRELFNEEKPEVLIDSDDLISIDENKFRIAMAGGKVLEDGVIVIFELYDEDNYLIWLKTWEHIDVTELSLNSYPTVFQGDLYIVVDGSLNIIDLITGDTKMIVDDVGKSEAAPVIDENGTVFTIGQYEPFVTAIDNEGEIIWQIRDKELTHAYEIKIDNDVLLVETLSGTCTLTKDGEINSISKDDDI